MHILVIEKNQFDKLKNMFPGTEQMWNKYKKMRISQLDKNEIEIFAIEENDQYIGELTVNYKSNQLESETIPNIRVYFEAFRIDKAYRRQGLGQWLINYSINYLKNKGYTEFTVGVEETNEIAKYIYFKFGFDKEIDRGHGDEFDPTEYILYLKK